MNAFGLKSLIEVKDLIKKTYPETKMTHIKEAESSLRKPRLKVIGCHLVDEKVLLEEAKITLVSLKKKVCFHS